MSLPNLRFNKTLTKRLIKSSPEEKVNIQTIKWHLENSNQNFGSYTDGLFKTTLFFLQQMEEDRFRLVIAQSDGFLGIYIIDDIDAYLNYIGAMRLEMLDDTEVSRILNTAKELPNTGIICIDEDKIFIYDHKNY